MHTLKISLIGPSGAGKSTFLRWAIHTIESRAGQFNYTINWTDNPFRELGPDEDAPQTPNPQLARGNLTLFDQKYKLEVTDTPGDWLDVASPPAASEKLTDGVAATTPAAANTLAEAISQSDLLILVVDPETVVQSSVMNKVITDLTTAVESVVSCPAIVIAYTKADEYGILGTLRQRFIDTPVQRRVLRQWCRAVRKGFDIDANWHRLVNAVCPAKEAGAPTRRRLLFETSRLWQQLAATKIDSGRFNAYFVTARAADPHARPDNADRLGLVNIVTDFVRVTAETRNRPHFRLGWSAIMCFAATLFLTAVLVWPHLGWWTLPAVSGAGVVTGVGGCKAVIGQWGGGGRP